MQKKFKSKKSIALLVSLVLVLTIAVGTTLAYLIDVTDPLPNVFTASKVAVEVEEDFKNNVKSNVTVKNTGDTTAYIRAAVVITWQNKAGEVYGKQPVEGVDYTAFTPATGWVEHSDGFYYHKTPIVAGASTGLLIPEIRPVGNNAPDGYYLCVEILASGIQSEPNRAVVDAWGIDPSNLG